LQLTKKSVLLKAVKLDMGATLRLPTAGAMAISLLFVAGCSIMLNSGLDQPGTASVFTKGDPGVYDNLQSQASANEAERPFAALYRSEHSGGAEDGVGTTQWTYVRGIEFSVAELSNPKFAAKLSDEIRGYFANCPRQLDAGTKEDAIYSGVIAGSGRARLILTRLDWASEVGPGPNQFATTRIKNVALKVFGSSVRLKESKPLTLSINIAYASATGNAIKLEFARTIPGIRTDVVTTDCTQQLLVAPTVDLGSSGWFAREGVFNLHVTLEEQ
jgi:hypothetical protein